MYKMIYDQEKTKKKKSQFYKYYFVHEEWGILIPQGGKVSTFITLFQCFRYFNSLFF